MKRHLHSLLDWILDAAEDCGWPYVGLNAATACVTFLIGITMILAF